MYVSISSSCLLFLLLPSLAALHFRFLRSFVTSPDRFANLSLGVQAVRQVASLLTMPALALVAMVAFWALLSSVPLF